MTENESLMILENLKPGCGEQLVFPESEICEAIDISISALKEIQQYQEIGTLEKCEEAVEKQKPKLCEFYGDEEDGKILCPNCGKHFTGTGIAGFCYHCGQRLKWEEEK